MKNTQLSLPKQNMVAFTSPKKMSLLASIVARRGKIPFPAQTVVRQAVSGLAVRPQA